MSILTILTQIQRTENIELLIWQSPSTLLRHALVLRNISNFQWYIAISVYAESYYIYLNIYIQSANDYWWSHTKKSAQFVLLPFANWLNQNEVCTGPWLAYLPLNPKSIRKKWMRFSLQPINFNTHTIYLLDIQFIKIQKKREWERERETDEYHNIMNGIGNKI